MSQKDLDLSRNEVRTVVLEPAMDEDEMEVDLGEVVLSVLRDWKILVVGAVLCAVICAAAVKVLPQVAASKSYTASTTVYLAKRDNVADMDGANALDMMMLYLMNNIGTAYNPAQEFRSVVTDRTVLQKVIDDLNLNMSFGALEDSIEITDEKNTRMVRIDLKNKDPEQARETLEHLREASIDSLARLMEDEPLVASYTEVALQETAGSGNGLSPKKMALIGGAAGFLILAMISVLLAMFDNRIKNARDVERYLDLPIMAVVTDRKG